MNRFLLNLTILVSWFSGVLHAQDCPMLSWDKNTDDFVVSGSSDQGAVGDVVAVDLSLNVGDSQPGTLFGMTLVGTYDSNVLELLPEVLYAPAFDAMAGISDFQPKSINGVPRGFQISAGLKNTAQYFPNTVPVSLATVFFRVRRGSPGDSLDVKIGDLVFPGGGCLRTHISYFLPNDDLVYAHSTRHVAGNIKVLPGEPTKPDLPSLPPNARVYPEAPTPESAEITYELTGGVAAPGAADVPLDLFITSNYEFHGFAVSLRFPPEYLSITAVEEHTRPGVVKIDNEHGALGMFMANSTRRVGAEGERVRIATLRAALREAAVDGMEILPRFEKFEPYLNFVIISYEEKKPFEPLPVTASVEALSLNSKALLVRDRLLAPRGDANFDGVLDIADAVGILAYLFLGDEEPACPLAADFDLSAVLDISDPIGILGALFLGEPPLSSLEPRELPCR